jgi:[protein-PII] uridylyltransferase
MRLAPSNAVADRIRTAPRAYLLANAPEVVVRQAALLDPPPRRGVLRVRTDAIDELSGLIEISTQDRPGLLAAVTGAFTARQIDIVDASTVVWPDGAVVESFTVRSAAPFRTAIGATGDLNAEITRRLHEPPTSDGMPDLEVDYDNDASPWYTLCEVRGQDRPGFLHTITVGFASASVTVHSARIETIGGVAIDHFELSDTDGQKLRPDLQRAARDAMWSGRAPSETRRGRFGRRRAATV